MITRTQILYSPNPYTRQSQIEDPVKCMQIVAFCRKNTLVSEIQNSATIWINLPIFSIFPNICVGLNKQIDRNVFEIF